MPVILHVDDTEENRRLVQTLLADNYSTALDGSCEFQEREFRDPFVAQVLLEALAADGVAVPEATTEIEALNQLLKGSQLHRNSKGIQVLPGNLSDRETMLEGEKRVASNRALLQAAYPTKCPTKFLEAGRLDAAIAQLRKRSVDVVLLDLTLPDSHGVESVVRIREAAKNVPVIVMTGLDEDDLAMECIRVGAQDYFTFGDVEAHRLKRAIQFAIIRAKGINSLERLIHEKRLAGDYDVFLCYTHQDSAFVQDIAHRLLRQGILPWYDKFELQPGENWLHVLQKQIETIAVAAVFIGEGGVGPWQESEVGALLHQLKQRRCKLLPVIVPGGSGPKQLPLFLANLHCVDFREALPDPFNRLVWGITGKSRLLERHT